MCNRVLKKLLLGAVDDMFINGLKHRHVGYSNVTTLQILTHLYDNYANIVDFNLIDNQNTMNELYNVNLSIESFFTLIENCVDYAQAGGTPFTPQQVVSSASNTIQRTGMYTDSCKVWRRLLMQAKIWALFKSEFNRTHNESCETQETTRSAGFHANNAENFQRETVDAIVQLLNANIIDRTAIAALITTVSNLTIELA